MESHDLPALDLQIRARIYDSFLETGRCDAVETLAHLLGAPQVEIRASLKRLAEAHMLVLQPESGEVLMAIPFSAVPTAFRVESGDRGWWGNCIWDALGICAMTGANATVVTSCPDCGEGMSLTVESGALLPAPGIVHFAVPAARWWEDVVFT